MGKIRDPDDKTKVIDLGGGNYGILFPEVYFRFVSTLYREHQDLVRAMQLADVKLNDGSALDYLNLMLGTSVNRMTPMEVGYAELLDALNMRIVNKHSESKIQQSVDAFKSHQVFNSPPDGKIFPDLPDQ